MKKIIIAVLLVANVCFGQNSTTEVQKAKLYQGTMIKCALNNTLKGGSTEVGKQVDLTLAEPIIIGDKVIVQKGAKILGSITDARSSGILGRKGKLAFSIDYLYMPNGQVIQLTSQNEKRLNGSGAAVVVTAVLVAPVALFIVGKGAKYESGTVFDAFIAKDTFID